MLGLRRKRPGVESVGSGSGFRSGRWEMQALGDDSDGPRYRAPHRYVPGPTHPHTHTRTRTHSHTHTLTHSHTHTLTHSHTHTLTHSHTHTHSHTRASRKQRRRQQGPRTTRRARPQPQLEGGGGVPPARKARTAAPGPHDTPISAGYRDRVRP